ncbi:MAG: hypothetical protein HN737_04725 [Desulfobacterales bacterium]|jgi:hypothetical protein|nr:hypothetical protein [Desulfobacteraceae bacterium]MBT4365623.1 hypothetical protein [Desulfobacteraceae bacterium]MBT7086518.1 hypothetical protein [Desulfobacterales bacterium]MBT7696697.1 hypothetical protein [Desulfobacterales bacterium]
MDKVPFGTSTTNTIKELLNQGINRISVIIRHSARNYDKENPEREAFMTLTENGKNLSYKFGSSIPNGIVMNLYSSSVGRCIETAYLIDKGYVAAGGKTISNVIDSTLSPFYVRSAQELFKLIGKPGDTDFISRWFSGEISTELIDNPEDAAKKIVKSLAEKTKKSIDDNINVCISHDWNLFLVKEYFLKQRYKDHRKVEYLEGVIVYEKDDKLFITNHKNKNEISL